MTERRFQVHKWVSGDGVTRRTSTDGTETFKQLWDRSPSGTRWAVVSDDQGFAVLDLRDIRFDTNLLVQLQREHRQPTIEAAIACAVLMGNPPLSLMGVNQTGIAKIRDAAQLSRFKRSLK